MGRQAGDQLEAVGAIIVKSKCSTLDGTVTLYAERRMAVGKSWLAVMMMLLLLRLLLLRWLPAAWLTAGRRQKKE